jgi:hypothetical protein
MKTTYEYNSIEEALQGVKQATNGQDDYIIERILKSKGTAGTEKYTSIAAGCKKILNGDRKLTEAYEREAAQFHFAPLTETGQYQFADEPISGMFDVATYCSNTGNEYWLNEIEAPKQNKAIKIYINMAAQASVNQTDYFRKLIKIIAYIDAMEAAGTRCEVWAVLFCEGDNYPDLKIRVKEQGEPVNIGQMVYQMATPVLLRFVYFFLSAKTNGTEYGYTVSDKDREYREARIVKLDGDIYIPSFYIPFENRYGHTINEMYPSYFNHLSI